MTTSMDNFELEKKARQHGFEAVGSVSIDVLKKIKSRGDTKKYIPENTETFFIFFQSYPLADPINFKDYSEEIRIAYFARIYDYHDILKRKLKEISQELTAETGRFHSWWGADDHSLPEKYLAKKAGLGFWGLNTLLINRDLGSFGFLGVIASPLKFEEVQEQKSSPVEKAHIEKTDSCCYKPARICEDCFKCLKACPVDALSKEKIKLDSDKCISSLTQRRGRFDWRRLAQFQNHFWGCDICQQVCPCNKILDYGRKNYGDYDAGNRGISADHWPRVGPMTVNEVLKLRRRDLPSCWSSYAFGWRGTRILVRNMLIVLANNLKPVYVKEIEEMTRDPSPIIRFYAFYCLYRWYWQENKDRAKNFIAEKIEEEKNSKNLQTLKNIWNSREEFVT
ncbi:epoxyqueuosine reductase [Halarsenatibacter silvermanii]|uniref:Epoxyqueuosine reductase n=1 Tax=Halarsenatibacter silvermanii TaxID=321763 RepID=A0A1G9NW16_9FIRM|nr:QueG-associated DUF1730 domain-containing protein [Halarsenatibacter silvermanii]SDL90580.1 epoxyqueuosine reductase [Halarsenatibacter silvermanii]